MVVTHATVLAYGGLQSEVSSRLTFPTLTNYRLVTVHGFRRVFAHPHFFLCGSGLVDPLKSKEAGSLSVERATGSSFVAAAFDVDMDASERAAFEEREIEYQIREIPFHSLGESSDAAPEGEGLLCLANTNEGLTVDMRATPWVQSLPQGWGVWSWPYDSGLLPAQMSVHPSGALDTAPPPCPPEHRWSANGQLCAIGTCATACSPSRRRAPSPSARFERTRCCATGARRSLPTCRRTRRR